VATPAESFWPDGMAVDDEGMLWATCGRTGAVQRYRPDGILDAVDVDGRSDVAEPLTDRPGAPTARSTARLTPQHGGSGRAADPQDSHPFPREAVRRRWPREIADPAVHCDVVVLEGAVAGFAAVRRDEFLHLGVALEHWGSGLAGRAHDAVIESFAQRGIRRAWLLAFTEHHRGRRFHEKHRWQPTGELAYSLFAPRPELMRYELDIEPEP